MICSCDFETRSDVDLRTRGLGPYFASPHWRALILCYSFDGGLVQTWTGGPCPDDLRAHIEAGGTISAWNASFERRCFDELARRHGWPRPALEQYVCSMATAAALSLPQSLDKAAQILDTTAQKDDAGKALIKKFSVPRRPRKDEDPNGGPYWHEPEDHREDFDRFVRYCQADIRAEQAIVAKMLPLRPECQKLYTITERINARGIRIDITSAKAAQVLAEKAKADLDHKMRALTGNAVTACSQVGKLTAWLAERVPDFDSLAKADILDALEREDLPDDAREALVLRQTYAKSSVGKLDAMLARADTDGRVRGSFVFRSAGTGRYASKGVQYQNFPRERKVFEDANIDRRVLFEAIRTGEPDFLRLLYGDPLGQPLPLLSDALRGMLWSAPKHDLLAADYSGIEGAVGAWLAGEEWKVRALFEIMADPSKPDMYRRSAAGIFGTTTDLLTKKDPRRQVGKVAELACFAAGTRVLARRGVVNIEDVRRDDLLWNGSTWSTHQGLIERGVRPVVTVDGIDVTEDHLISTRETWRPVKALVSNRSILSQARETGLASLRSLALAEASVWFSFSARAAWRRILSIFSTCSKARQAGAATAVRAPLRVSVKATLATMTLWRTRGTALVCSIVSQRRSSVAATPTTKATRTTAAEEFVSNSELTGALFWPTLSRWLAGTIRHWIWTVSTATGTTLSEISGSYQEAIMQKTSEKSKIYKPVFDILNCSTGNKFTVLTDTGAFVVHNCQYGGGVGSFRSMARGYAMKLRPMFEPAWEAADGERREKASARYEECVARGDPLAKELTREEWIACELVKVGWRKTHPAFTAAWKACSTAVRAAVDAPGEQFSALDGKLTFLVRRGFLWMRLPSGRCLAFGAPSVREVEVPWSDKTVEPALRERQPTVTVLGQEQGRTIRYPLLPTMIYQNATQAIALDLLDNGIVLAEEAGYPVVGHVHDEIITEVPRGWGDVGEFERLICQLPPWAAGLPLTASGWRGKRYRK